MEEELDPNHPLYEEWKSKFRPKREVILQAEQSDGSFVTATGVTYTVLKEGSGEKAGENRKVGILYQAFLYSENDKKFGRGTLIDKSGSTPLEFITKTGAVIEGLDPMAISMKEREERNIIIPSEMAFGEEGQRSTRLRGAWKVPPNTPMVFWAMLDSFIEPEEPEEPEESQDKPEKRRGLSIPRSSNTLEPKKKSKNE